MNSNYVDDKIIASVNSMVTIQCHSNVVPYWTHNGGPLQENTISLSRNELLISPISMINKGVYECEGLTRDNMKFMIMIKLYVTGN